MSFGSSIFCCAYEAFAGGMPKSYDRGNDWLNVKSKSYDGCHLVRSPRSEHRTSGGTKNGNMPSEKLTDTLRFEAYVVGLTRLTG